MTLKITLLCLFWIFVNSRAEDIFATTLDGRVKGKREVNANGTSFYSFYSIPYAKAPIGSLRFQAPVPVDPWEDVFDATFEKSICYQVYDDYPEEDEDCLFLNIYTPQNPSNFNNSLPVMVYIHGGGFIAGSGRKAAAPPNLFMDQNVVLVTINYRLGPFGFLSTGDNIIPGNAGLKDQVLSLKWVQKNIKGFGGDPNRTIIFGQSAGGASIGYQVLSPLSSGFLSTGDNIIPGNAGLKDQVLSLKWVQKNIKGFGGDPNRTIIFGQSAGGASIGYQVLSPLSSGLFRGAILQSGSCLVPWAYQRDETDIAFKTASFMNPEFDSERDSNKLWSYLQSVTSKQIDIASYNYSIWASSLPESVAKAQVQQGFYYAPVIEVPNNEAFLTDLQYQALSSGRFNKVPIVIGICSEEGLINYDEYLNYTLQAYDNDYSALVPGNLHLQNQTVKQEVGTLIKQEYSPSSLFLNNPLGGIQYFTEQDFAKSIIKHAELQSTYTDVFFYMFSYSGKMGGNSDRRLPGSGNVTHSEEMGYLLTSADTKLFPEADQKVSARLVKFWTNFAYYLNPTPEEDSVLQNIIWPRVKPDNFNYIDMGENLTVQANPKAKGYAFWTSIYDKYGVCFFDTY